MSFHLTIEPEWNIISKIRQASEKAEELSGQNRDFMEATRLTAIELVENALKYSDAGGGDRPVSFDFELNNQNDHITITVTNPCTDQKRKQVLDETVAEINGGDPFSLYVQRLEALKDNPDGHSRMGLYRIAYEAEFKLSLQIKPAEVRIQAVRKLEGVS